mgnify:CR=1 FL=1
MLTDAYPGAADCDKPAITQRTTPPRTRPSKRKGAAARRPSKRVARTVTPPDLHNVVPPFDDDYDALGLGAGCGWLDDIFDEGHALQPSYEESLEDLGLDEVKARCAAAGLDAFGERGEFHTLARVWDVPRHTALGVHPKIACAPKFSF